MQPFFYTAWYCFILSWCSDFIVQLTPERTDTFAYTNLWMTLRYFFLLYIMWLHYDEIWLLDTLVKMCDCVCCERDKASNWNIIRVLFCFLSSLTTIPGKFFFILLYGMMKGYILTTDSTVLPRKCTDICFVKHRLMKCKKRDLFCDF